MHLIMRSIEYKKNDIVILWVDEEYFNFKKNDIKVNLTDIFNQLPENCSCFWDNLLHANHEVNKLIAQSIYSTLMNKDLLIKDSTLNKYPNRRIRFGNKETLLSNEEIEIQDWINKNNYTQYCSFKGKNGAIVMNCNPFTNGHRYLIEIAAKQCDILFIFVVETNSTNFSFNDRYELVRKGTEDIDNVVVLKSGSYMISYKTMPGYFNKEKINRNKGEVNICDYNYDLTLFAKYIAQFFNISIRFVGTEPLDNFTKTYNEAMKKMLPLYGIDLIEIDRKKLNNIYISASYVRSLLKDNRFDEIKKFVPRVTYEFLLKNFFS